MAKKEKLEMINNVNWWHSIDLGDGVVTPGDQGQTSKYHQIGLLDLKRLVRGKTVLDIGAWDGISSFECEKAGAIRVVAMDEWAWRDPGRTDKGFFTARKILNSNVEYLNLSVYDLSPDRVGTFDTVIFFGVLYHLRYPLLALEKIHSVTKEVLVLSTHTAPQSGNIPYAEFYPNNEFKNDFTTWWVPTVKCLEAMLASSGFTRFEVLATWKDSDGRDYVTCKAYPTPIESYFLQQHPYFPRELFYTAGKRVYMMASKSEERRDYEIAQQLFKVVVEILTKKSVSKNPETRRLLSGAHFHLGNILKAQGKTKEARYHLQTCLKIDPGHTKAKKLIDSISTIKQTLRK